MLETFTVQTFAPQVNDTFRVFSDSSAPMDMTLIDVTDLGPASERDAAQRRAPFSLVFRGPRTGLLPQRIYRIEHHALGAFDLFLVPIGPDNEGMRYEAIFT